MSKTDETIGQLYQAAQEIQERFALAVAVIVKLKGGDVGEKYAAQLEGVTLDRIALTDGGFQILPPPEEPTEEENMRVLRG